MITDETLYFMDTYQVEIIKPEAKKMLDNMEDMHLITVRQMDVKGRNGNGVPGNQREAIMSLAGSWAEISENEFQEYLSEAKRSGHEIFDRDFSL